MFRGASAGSLLHSCTQLAFFLLYLSSPFPLPPRRFACSVALSSVPGIPKDKEIVVQGNLGFEAEAYLAEHCGVPKHLIELDASKGGKLKKRK
jgi:hypothetical protein